MRSERYIDNTKSLPDNTESEDDLRFVSDVPMAEDDVDRFNVGVLILETRILIAYK